MPEPRFKTSLNLKTDCEDHEGQYFNHTSHNSLEYKNLAGTHSISTAEHPQPTTVCDEDAKNDSPVVTTKKMRKSIKLDGYSMHNEDSVENLSQASLRQGDTSPLKNIKSN